MSLCVAAALSLCPAPPLRRTPRHAPLVGGQLLVEASESEDALRLLNELLELRGRCSLAEAGEKLRSEGVVLPPGQSLSAFVDSCDGFVLSGRPSNRQISLAGQTTASAMVTFVVDVLQQLGTPVSIRELKQRISERGRFVPGLAALLRSHEETFVLSNGLVGLREAGAETALASAASVTAPSRAMARLQSMELSGRISDGSLPPPEDVTEVVIVDMDNKAFLLEPCAAYAARNGVASCSTLVIGFCATTHNPRISPDVADQIRTLSDKSWLKVMMPVRDTKNAADFVCSFWAGWLHSSLPRKARFTILSTDIHLERTLVDLLNSFGRQVISNPPELQPGVAPPNDLHIRT